MTEHPSASLTRRAGASPGLLAAVVFCCLYGGLALSVDFPRAAFGFQSDESTYYLMAYSLASDGDLVYRREDLARTWKEFPTGPTGLFLKRGRDLELRFDARFPFVSVTSRADPDQTRLYFGKSFAYPLCVAPWVWLFGTNGFLLFHAGLLGVVLLAGYLFLSARTAPTVSVLLASGFLLASVAPSYLVWTTPEIFNFSTVFLAYFCWLYREVAVRETAPRGTRWLFGSWAAPVSGLLLGVATFSKPSNALLLLPMVIWHAWYRRWREGIVTTLVFAASVAAFFMVNVAVTGDWNFQGGDRRTFVTAFPFLPGGADFDVGMDRTTNTVLVDVIFDPQVFWTVLAHNLVYVFVGRHSGLVPYFFPAVFAIGAFVLAGRKRAPWQTLVLLAAAAELLLVLIWIPYNYFGGGGVLGNRYFMNTYGLFLFLLPPLDVTWIAVVPWLVGGLFTAQITLNPFFAAFHPAEHAMHGPLRWLPVELSLTNDLPINTSESRVRVPFGTTHPFQMYFLDANAYPPEADGSGFWVRGESRAECLIKSAPGVRRLMLSLTNADKPNRVVVRVSGRSRVVQLAPREVAQVTLPLDEGFPYLGSRVWKLTIASRAGSVPMFARGGVDYRFVGVLVKPEIMP